MGVAKRFAPGPQRLSRNLSSGRSFFARPTSGSGFGSAIKDRRAASGIRYGFVLDESWQEFGAIMKSLKRNVRTRVARKAIREAADRTVVPETKRYLVGITKRRSRGRGVKADLTRAWAKGLKRKNIRRSRVRVGVRIYAPTRDKLERLMKGRYKARYRGYPPAHVEYGARKNVSRAVWIKRKDGSEYMRRGHTRQPMRRLAPMKKAAIRASSAYINQMGRAFMKYLRMEFHKEQRSGAKRALKWRGVKVPRHLR